MSSLQRFIMPLIPVFIITSAGCKTKRQGQSATAEEQCIAAQDYTWMDGICRLTTDVEKEKKEQDCLEKSDEFTWINGSCVEKKSIQSPREACESRNDGSSWQSDPSTGKEVCVGPAQDLSAREECLQQSDDGYIWEDGVCLSPEAQTCQSGGDIWTDGKCMIPAENECVRLRDGSEWDPSGRCKGPDEISCEKRGYRFTWDLSIQDCRLKEFLDYCTQPATPGSDLDITMEALMSLPGITRDDCAQASRDLNNLTSVTLRNKQLRELSPLSNLKQLEELDLQFNAISDLTPLKGLRLVSLNLSGNAITNVSPLGELSTLTELSLTENQVVDPGPLSGLKKLQTLYLKNNRIVDISLLVTEESHLAGGLAKLQTLDLSGHCGLKDIRALLKLKSLKQLSILNTGIESKALPTFPAGNVMIYHSQCP